MYPRRIERRIAHLFISKFPYPMTLLRKHIKFFHNIFCERYTDADPFKLVWVDPLEIERADIGGYRKLGRVYGGNWDRTASQFDELPRVKSIYNHFRNEISWEETAFFKKEMELIQKRGYDRYGCTNRSEVIARFTRIDNLYHRISNGGYKSQRQLLTEAPEETMQRNNDEPLSIINEIGVNIGRNGEFIFLRCGLHRLAIAKILELDKVPVLIRVRHKQWQKHRNKLRSGISTATTIRSHPDMQDIIDG